MLDRTFDKMPDWLFDITHMVLDYLEGLRDTFTVAFPEENEYKVPYVK